jgi:hypothetical protein
MQHSHQPRRQDGVLAFVAANPGATVAQIHEALRRGDMTMTYDSVCKATRKLIARQRIRKGGTNTLHRSQLFLTEQRSDAPTS